MADRKALREELRRILDKPIFPHEKVDPVEAVTDYLLDNDVVPVVRCRDCKWYTEGTSDAGCFKVCKCPGTSYSIHPTPVFFCACAERRGAISNG